MRSFDTEDHTRAPRERHRIAGRLFAHPEGVALVLGGAALALVAGLVILFGPG